MMSLCAKLRATCDQVNARNPKTHAAVQLCALLLPWPTAQVGRSSALDLNLITWVLTVYPALAGPCSPGIFFSSLPLHIATA